jgi:hypothetical protein
MPGSAQRRRGTARGKIGVKGCAQSAMNAGNWADMSLVVWASQQPAGSPSLTCPWCGRRGRAKPSLPWHHVRVRQLGPASRAARILLRAAVQAPRAKGLRLRGRSAMSTSTDPLDRTAGLRHRGQPVRDGRASQQHCRGSNLRQADSLRLITAGSALGKVRRVARRVTSAQLVA